MLTAMRTAHPGAGRIAAILVAECTRNDENFFTAVVLVCTQARVRRPLQQCHRFIVEIVQRHNLNFTLGFQPCICSGVDAQSFAIAGVDNPLFLRENTRMLFGDARESLDALAKAI